MVQVSKSSENTKHLRHLSNEIVKNEKTSINNCARSIRICMQNTL